MDIGRVYVIKLVLPDSTVVHKVGMCHSSRSTDRLMEILKSWFNYFRFVPYAELRLDMKCEHPLKIEKFIHKILEPNSFEPEFPVQGRTEMFLDVDEVRLIWFMKSLQNGKYSEPPEVDDFETEQLFKLLTVNHGK